MPYAQGQLDGLCGVYAIVNAIEATVANWDRTDAQSLFHFLTTSLTAEGKLPGIMALGMGRRDLGQLIDHADTYLAAHYGLRLTRRFAFARPTSLGQYWQRLENHLQAPGHTAIVGLCGRYAHWTCVHEMTGNTLQTLDSGTQPIQRLYRAHCTTRRLDRRRHHGLQATQTVLLKVS